MQQFGMNNNLRFYVFQNGHIISISFVTCFVAQGNRFRTEIQFLNANKKKKDPYEKY